MGYYEAYETLKFILDEHSDTGEPLTIILALDAYLMPMNKAKAANEYVSWTPKKKGMFGKAEYTIDFYSKVLISKAALKNTQAKTTVIKVTRIDKTEPNESKTLLVIFRLSFDLKLAQN